MNQTMADLDNIFQRYPEKPEYLIFLLQDIQAEYGYISRESMQEVCDRINVPLTQAYSVATFYKSFRLDPSGEHDIRVCMGTACHLKGGQRIADELERRIGVAPGETTEDLKITLNTVNCLGACSLAPVVVVDEEYLPNMTAQKIDTFLKTINQEDADIAEEIGHA